jgi:hypothetical protein
MIEKSMRTFSEKTTSVEHDIERSQKGIVRQTIRTARGGRVIVIPTIIKNPKVLTITPLNNKAAIQFHNAGGWFSDLNLYHASNASVSLSLIRSATTTSVANIRLADSLVLYNRDLYIAVGAVTATQSASASLITGSKSLFKKLDEFSDNAKAFLKVTGRSASAGSNTNVYFAYEVRGY